ncbi:unnamed protein product [Symbiodinium microadriaticum]|nr:unnamed protein product [Symbiodinium microadriaticum]
MLAVDARDHITRLKVRSGQKRTTAFLKQSAISELSPHAVAADQEALAALTLALQDDDYDIRKCMLHLELLPARRAAAREAPMRPVFLGRTGIKNMNMLILADISTAFAIRAFAPVFLAGLTFGRVAAAEVLAQLGVAGNMAPIMIANAWLDDARQHVRRLAVQILGRSCAGHCARDALDAAVGHLRDRRFFVRKGAVEVLGTGNAVAFCYLQGTVEVA